MSVDLVRAIKVMYQVSEACVRVNGEISEWFEVKQGARQGCPMHVTVAFNIFLHRYGSTRLSHVLSSTYTLPVSLVGVMDELID